MKIQTNKQDFGLCTFGLNEKKATKQTQTNCWGKGQEPKPKLRKPKEPKLKEPKPNEKKLLILRCLWFTVMLTALLNGTIEERGGFLRVFESEVLENRFHFVASSALTPIWRRWAQKRRHPTGSLSSLRTRCEFLISSLFFSFFGLRVLQAFKWMTLRWD